MKTMLLRKLCVSGLVFGIALVVMLSLMPTGVVYARVLNDPPIPPDVNEPKAGEQTKQVERLEKLYQKLLKFNDRVVSELENTEKIKDGVEERIKQWEEKDKDVTQLENTLQAYIEGVDKARDIYEQAKSLLDAHAGFDVNGKVIDREKAGEMIKGSFAMLRECHLTTKEARHDLRIEIRKYRLANRVNKTGASQDNVDES